MADLLMKMPIPYEPKRANRFIMRFPSTLGINEWFVESAKRLHHTLAIHRQPITGFAVAMGAMPRCRKSGHMAVHAGLQHQTPLAQTIPKANIEGVVGTGQGLGRHRPLPTRGGVFIVHGWCTG